VTVGALLFWIFIGLPIVGTVLWWVVMIVCAPFLAIGAGARTVKENRADKRVQTISTERKKLDDAEDAHRNQVSLAARRDAQVERFTHSFDEKSA
jgi:hypothetical protein